MSFQDGLPCVSVRDWTCLALGFAAAGISLYVYSKLSCTGGICSKGAKKNVVNLNIKKEDSKVVNTFDIEDIGDKKVYCRCWRSAIFPLCDGSHNKHNETTGDNVGPLIIAKKTN